MLLWSSCWIAWGVGHQPSAELRINGFIPALLETCWNLVTWHQLYPDLQPGVPSVVVFPPRTASLIYACPDVSQSRWRHHLVLGVIWGSLTELEVGTAERNMTWRHFYEAYSLFPSCRCWSDCGFFGSRGTFLREVLWKCEARQINHQTLLCVMKTSSFLAA